MKNSRFSSKFLARASALTALALGLSYVEVLIPFSIGIPGVKLGLANIVIVYALYTLDGRYAVLINVCRVMLSALLFGSVFSMLYALSGAALSLMVMLLLKKPNIFGVCAVSAAGGVFHNLGQLLTAMFVVKTSRIILYFPLLVFSGLTAGVLNGFITVLCMKRLTKF